MEFKVKNKHYSIEYINTQEKLMDCVEHLNKSTEFGFDLEFDRDRFTYGFHLCLIQLCTETRCFIVDPLSKINLTPLFKTFQNEKILKIAYSCDQDLQLLHLQKCYPKNIFDIEIAIKLLNYDYAGLGKIVHAKFNIELDKKLQTSNWNLRPMTMQQMEYSSNDVIYLIKLRHILEIEIEQKNLQNWLKEEHQYLDTIVYKTRNTDSFLTEDEENYMTDYHKYIFNELLRFRDKIAKANNKPAFKIFDRKLIKEILFEKNSFDNWMELKNIYYKVQNQTFKKEISALFEKLKCDANALNLNQIHLPWTDEQKAQRKEENKLNGQIKEEMLKPIQLYLEEKYGKFTARYFFSETFMNDMFKHGKRISEIKPDYKKNLIITTAKELNLDIERFL